MKIVQFWDMHSGGKCKFRGFEKIYVFAEDKDAGIRKFEEVTGRDPYHVTCNCCGDDYSVTEYDTLSEATEFHRTKYKRVGSWKAPRVVESIQPVADYVKKSSVLVMYADGTFNHKRWK